MRTHESITRATHWTAVWLLVLSTAAGCGGEAVATASHQLIGDWFRCEFFDDKAPAPPTDSCAMLDDDGLRFDYDGQVYDIEVKGSTETGCADDNAGACFLRTSEQVDVAGERIGSYSIDDDGHVTIVEEDGDRSEFDLVLGDDYSQFSNFVEHKNKGDETETKYSYVYRYR